MPSCRPEIVFSNSACSTFLSCMRKYYYRYIKKCVALETRDVLSFGSVMHGGMELFYGSYADDERLLAHIDSQFPDAPDSDSRRHLWHHARALTQAYVDYYDHGDLGGYNIQCEVPLLEPIIPRRGARKIHSARFTGQIDMVLSAKNAGEYPISIVEHKTSGRIDGAYISKLWEAPQTILYQHFLSQSTKKEVTHVTYNLMQTRLAVKQAVGESEAEFAERYEQAMANNKSGKTSVRRKEPETDAEFEARLLDLYRQPGTFQRQEILTDKHQREQVVDELVNTIKVCRHVMHTGQWLRNRAQCRWGYSECEYLAACNARDTEEEEAILTSNYRYEAPHSEVRFNRA
jgi:hypothetical protein